MPGIDNFTIYQGADFVRSYVYRDSLGALVDLTGYTARMQARKSVSSPLALIDLTTENEGIVLGGTAGTVELRMTDAQTAALSASHYQLFVSLVNPSPNA